jgi:hypothetical protein
LPWFLRLVVAKASWSQKTAGPLACVATECKFILRLSVLCFSTLFYNTVIHKCKP